ncbi:hypothetical protein M0R19_04695 [Candidatus Pacearchaeota archaeon]|jgi:GNAT superfamily N-acetyltransferase|nr:hypothetical protein [Candidatus Pacearchaeota archaeon]
MGGEGSGWFNPPEGTHTKKKLTAIGKKIKARVNNEKIGESILSLVGIKKEREKFVPIFKVNKSGDTVLQFSSKEIENCILCYKDKEVIFVDLRIRKDFRNKGIASKLIKNLFTLFYKNGFKTVNFKAGSTHGGYIWALMGAELKQPKDLTFLKELGKATLQLEFSKDKNTLNKINSDLDKINSLKDLASYHYKDVNIGAIVLMDSSWLGTISLEKLKKEGLI